MTTSMIDRPRGWRRWTPWRGRATTADKGLMAAILGVVAFGLLMRPVRPFLIASHPVLLEFLDGDLAAIGAAAAFARIGELPLWLVLLAGVAGLVKLDWLTWLAGRQWGQGMISYVVAGERAKRLAERARHANPWVLRLAVVVAPLPGIPTALVYVLAGWTRMRLITFLALDTLGAVLVTGLVAGLGYALGQHAVDVVLLIDRYAGLVSITILLGAMTMPLINRLRRRLTRRTSRPAQPGAAGSDPAVLPGDPERVGPAGRTELLGDRSQVVADRAG